VDGSVPQIFNIVAVDNSARFFGGAIACWGSYPVIVNSILWTNSATNDPEINIEYGSAPMIMYCNINDSIPGDGNINVEPLFRDTENNDYHLMAIECGDSCDSPLIDAGNPNNEDDSLDCDWGLGTLISDMGAYGGGIAQLGIDDNESVKTPERITLSQNYPNPFNAVTTIHYNLPTASDIVIDIYDILGRRVEALYKGQQQAGKHSIIWNADRFSSGAYFYKLTADDFRQTRKMMLLK